MRDVSPVPAGVPTRLLESPTLGALRRRHGITGPCDEAKVLRSFLVADRLLAYHLVEELDGICRFVAAGGYVHQAAGRLARLLNRLPAPEAGDVQVVAS